MIFRFVLTLIGLALVLGAIVGIKALQVEKMTEQASGFSMPPEVISAYEVRGDSWESVLTAVGTLQAVQGVAVTANLPGAVVGIHFEPGTGVEAGELLIQQDIASEKAELRAAEATAELARISLERSRKLLAEKTVPPSDFDNAEARYKEAMAQADRIRETIAKKSVRAPFTGRLGIRRINLGQVLTGGEEIVSLQQLDPIFVNFFLPQHLAAVEVGFPVRISSESLPERTLEGRVTTVNPEVDSATRNLEIQATLDNPGERLRPGMFVNVTVVLPSQHEALAIPATAVLYAPYSDSVFVVEDAPEEQGGPPGKVLRQQFVRLGEKRGDFVAVTSGLAEGETVVSTGVFKLRNGQAVVVDNTHAPEFKLNPNPEDR